MLFGVVCTHSEGPAAWKVIVNREYAALLLSVHLTRGRIVNREHAALSLSRVPRHNVCLCGPHSFPIGSSPSGFLEFHVIFVFPMLTVFAFQVSLW